MNNKTPSVVLLDIETSPIIGYAWEAFDTNLLKIIQPSKIISVAWKELGEKKVHVKCISDYRSYSPNVVEDKELVQEIWNVLDKADVVIGHNSDSFDLKKLNMRFVVHKLNAPSPYQTIDTCKISKRYFKFDSNSLNNLCMFLELGEKVSHSGFSLWEKCMSGDYKAWSLMKDYNANDVVLLEKVYLALRPFQDRHPNLAVVAGESAVENCPSCLSKNLTKRGFSFTKTGRKQRYQCSDCFSWSTGSFQKGLEDGPE